MSRDGLSGDFAKISYSFMKGEILYIFYKRKGETKDERLKFEL